MLQFPVIVISDPIRRQVTSSLTRRPVILFMVLMVAVLVLYFEMTV